MTRFIKTIILVLTGLLYIFTGPVNLSLAKTMVFFEYPNPDQVFIKDERENIKGYISVAPETVASAEISFDGFVWRELPIDNSIKDGYYHFNYGWQVAGKGKSFIIVKAVLNDGKEIEDRLRYEVEIPPGSEEPSVRDLLNDIYAEQERRRQAELEEKPAVSLWTIASNFVENDFGDFLANNYLVILPFRSQFNIALKSFAAVIKFIKTYQAGVDILMFLINPYLIVVSLILSWYLIIYNLNNVWSGLNYLGYLVTRKREKNFDGIVFDIDDQHRVPWAKIVFRHNQTGQNTAVYSDSEGAFSTFLESGDYSYEIEKNNYRNYVEYNHPGETFLGYPVALDNIKVNSHNKYALPTASLLSLSRWNRHLKDDWNYHIRYALLNNITAITSISYLAMGLWLIFINDYRLWIYLGIITLAYAFYFIFERMNRFDGVVYLTNGKKAGLINLVLKNEDKTLLSIWTNHEGKFKIGNIPDGVYQLAVIDDDYGMEKETGFYQGEKFLVDKQNCCVLTIRIKIGPTK